MNFLIVRFGHEAAWNIANPNRRVMGPGLQPAARDAVGRVPTHQLVGTDSTPSLTFSRMRWGCGGTRPYRKSGQAGR